MIIMKTLKEEYIDIVIDLLEKEQDTAIILTDSVFFGIKNEIYPNVSRINIEKKKRFFFLIHTK